MASPLSVGKRRMLINTVTSPEVYRKPFHLFIAGGISGCSNWQDELIKDLRGAYWFNTPLILFNPRKESFDIKNKRESIEQIAWEHEMLSEADGVLFWFPSESICPITLFELGKIASRRDKLLFVGCHESYIRKFDVEQQMRNMRPEVVVRSTMEQLIGDFLSHIMKSELYS